MEEYGEWRTIEGSAGQRFSANCQVSANGWIINRSNGGKPHRGRLTKAGRYMAHVGKKERLVHRIVAETFIGPPPSESHTVDHIDRNPKNNAVKNLRWATRSEQNKNKDPRKRQRDSREVEVTAPNGVKTKYAEYVQAAKAVGCSVQYLAKIARTGKETKGYTAKYVAPEAQEIEGEVWKLCAFDPSLKVSTLGRLQRKQKRGETWGFKLTPSPTKDQQGYVYANTERGCRTPVHWIVMLTFFGESEDPLKNTIDHVNRVRHDNRLENLRWATRKEQNTNQEKKRRRFE